MSEYTDKTTIFYTLKLKRTWKPAELFEKLEKKIKKRGATKNWTYDIDGENGIMSIDFGDEMSETFTLSFNEKKICEGFCKVYFPLSGEEFDDEKKSEFKALINMLWSAKSAFSEMKIRDDYGAAESFIDSKINKIVFRELTGDETARAKRLFDEGHTNVPEFVMALLFDLRELPYDKYYPKYITTKLGAAHYYMMWAGEEEEWHFRDAFVDSFLSETSDYQNKGRLFDVDDYYSDLNGVYFSVIAFCDAVELLTNYPERTSGWDPKTTQVLRLYDTKFLQPFEAETDPFGKCVLAYRFLMSCYDYLGFKPAADGIKRFAMINKELSDGICKYIFDGDRDAYQKYYPYYR